MIHPNRSSKLPIADVVDSIATWFPRLHAIVIGPGLGRDPAVLSCAKEIINIAKQQQKNLVIDAV